MPLQACTLAQYGPSRWLSVWNVLDILTYVFQILISVAYFGRQAPWKCTWGGAKATCKLDDQSSGSMWVWPGCEHLRSGMILLARWHTSA